MRVEPGTAPLPRQPVSTRRLEAFTDGIFTIAATLLVLDLTEDKLGRVRTDEEMWNALTAFVPSVANLTVSFLLLGLLWILHVRQFEYIARVDRMLLWLNIVRLLGVVLMPFVTSLSDDYNEFLAGRMLLPLNFFALVTLGALQWLYATDPKRGLVTGLSADAIHNSRVNSLTAVGIAAFVIVLSAAVGSLAFLLFALDPLVRAVLRRSGVLRPVGDAHGEGASADANAPFTDLE